MNKKRIIFTAIVGTIALAALSVSISLAWYGASDRLSVSNLNVEVFTEAKLKISTSNDLFSFKDALDMNDFDEKYREMAFIPTSSMHQSAWLDKNAEPENRAMAPSFYDVYNDSMLYSSDTPHLNPSTYGFFSEELYLITNFDFYASLEVGLDNDEHCSFLPNERANEKHAKILESEHPEWNLTWEQIKEKLNNLVNCLRISILVTDETEYNYYIINPTKQGEDDITYYGGVLDNNGDGYFDTYKAEVDGEYIDTEVMYGEVNDRSLIVYDDIPEETSDGSSQATHHSSRTPEFFGDSFHASSKPGTRAYNPSKSKNNGFEIAKEPALSLAEIKQAQDNPSSSQENKDKSIIIPCRSNTPSRIVLSIYLEGWDLDCINATMGASFDITLYFNLLRGI